MAVFQIKVLPLFQPIQFEISSGERSGCGQSGDRWIPYPDPKHTRISIRITSSDWEWCDLVLWHIKAGPEAYSVQGVADGIIEGRTPVGTQLNTRDALLVKLGSHLSQGCCSSCSSGIDKRGEGRIVAGKKGRGCTDLSHESRVHHNHLKGWRDYGVKFVFDLENHKKV